MNDKAQPDEPTIEATDSAFATIRQWFFPSEFRIAPPRTLPNMAVPAGAPAPPDVEVEEQSAAPAESRKSSQFVAELATCLWYLKTKHFKRAWEDDGTDGNGSDDGPKVRRAIGRLNRGIDALKESGVEIEDPTNKRYPQGGEGMMRPLQFEPTAGLTFETVTETVTPIVYREGQLIQRGEVFVAVPQEDATTEAQPATTGDEVTGSSTNAEQDCDADAQKPAPENNH